MAANAGARKRFVREAQAAAAISHDHVVTIHSVDEWQPPHAASATLPYLVMHLVSGESLQQRLDRNGPLGLKEILRIGMQAAAGLAAAHAQGLIHRDVKPANILLENGVERVKITDFGLARAVGDATLTQTGVVAGTPQYMSPEQARGEAVDHRSDLFSLGSVLYAMCAGRAPFSATSTMGVLRSVCEDNPRPLTQINVHIPDWCVAIIDKLLAKTPKERFQSATEVAELLSQCLAHVQQPSATPLPDIPGMAASGMIKPPCFRRYLATAAVLFVIAAGVGFSEAAGVTQFLPMMIRIVTGEGTLVVQVDDPDVSVTIDGPDLVITGPSLKELRLRPGDYKVRTTKDGQPIRETFVTIVRGGKEILNISRQPLRQFSEVTQAKVAKAEPDAFVILGDKDDAERKFDTLADAILAASDGDTIEVRGNGPFVSHPIIIRGQSLVIRAAEGFRPLLQPSREAVRARAGLLETNSRLVIEGLEFRLTDYERPAMGTRWPQLITGRGPLYITNCSFLCDPRSSVVESVKAPLLDIRNCQLVIGESIGYGLGANGLVRFDNNVIMSNQWPIAIGVEGEFRSVSVRITRNTLVGEEPIAILLSEGSSEVIQGNDDRSVKRLSIQATHNVFVGKRGIFCFSQMPPFLERARLLSAREAQELLLRLVAWREEHNV